MNIVYHHRTQAQGAAGTHIRQLVQAFEKLGHTVDIVSPPFVKDPRSVEEQAVGVERSRIPQLIFESYEIFYNWISFFRLAMKLGRKKYSLMYERYAIFNIAGLLAARSRGIPIFIEVSFTSRTKLFPRRTRLLSGVAYLVDKALFRHVDAIIAVSSVLQRDLITYFHVDPSKILVIPNAVDETAFHPGISGKPVREKYVLGGHHVIGFVGGFYPWHGLDFLIDCVPDVLKRFPETKILLVGDGAVRKDLERKVGRLGLGKNVIFSGSISHKEVPSYIAAFDIGVMPDSNAYGSPLKILEYMAMKKVVVAPRLSPVEEILKAEEQGVLFDRLNKEQLVSALIRVLNDADLRRRVAENSYANVLIHHTWMKTAKTIIDHFNIGADKS
jgi:glycosyltransferase involved in cell wall biosynthesis